MVHIKQVRLGGVSLKDNDVRVVAGGSKEVVGERVGFVRVDMRDDGVKGRKEGWAVVGFSLEMRDPYETGVCGGGGWW